MSQEQESVTGPDGRPAFTLREAAHQCAVSLSTIRRRHQEGAFPQAFKTEAGEWRIPVSDLLAAGLHPGRSRSPDHTPDHESAAPERLSELHERVAEAERRAAVAEARLQEREHTVKAYSEALNSLRTTLRMLEPAASPQPEQTDQIAQQSRLEEPTPQPRVRLRDRLRQRLK